jgi:hypothetical protein
MRVGILHHGDFGAKPVKCASATASSGGAVIVVEITVEVLQLDDRDQRAYPAEAEPAVRLAGERRQELMAAAGTGEDEIVGCVPESPSRKRSSKGLARRVLDPNLVIRLVRCSRVLGWLCR